MYLYIILGIITGIFSGLFGIGGALILIPVFKYFFKFSQHVAQGTTLFLMVFPIGLLGVLNYFKLGYVKINEGLLVALGFFIGAFFGSKLAVTFSDTLLQKLFGVLLLGISLKMIIGK